MHLANGSFAFLRGGLSRADQRLMGFLSKLTVIFASAIVAPFQNTILSYAGCLGVRLPVFPFNRFHNVGTSSLWT